MSASYYAYAGVYALVQPVAEPVFKCKCSGCGQRASDTDNFCNKCGSSVVRTKTGETLVSYFPESDRLHGVELPKYCSALVPDDKTDFGVVSDLSECDSASQPIWGTVDIEQALREFEARFKDELDAAHQATGKRPVTQVGLLTWCNV